MLPNSVLSWLRGPFSFLLNDPDEIRRAFSDPERQLPVPQKIFLAAEEATPIVGYPILISRRTVELREALEEYIRAEETIQLARVRNMTIDTRERERLWEIYSRRLRGVTRNVTSSSYGRRFPSIFWLYHSIAVSRVFKETPRRLVQLNAQAGRQYGAAIKYRVYDRFLDRVLNLTYDEVHAAAEETGEPENTLFPALLEQMRDNVLILTEDYISADLTQLDHYFRAHLGVDAKAFRDRLNALKNWQEDVVRTHRDLRLAISHLLEVDVERAGTELWKHPGYAYFLTSQPSYDAERLLPPQQVPIWERLLIKLKQFELMALLRRLVVPIQESDGRCTCPDPRPAGPKKRGDIELSESTRPLDFGAPWVVDPVVHRFGLVYDITEFSQILSTVGRSGEHGQDSLFRHILLFQRTLNRLASGLRLKLEKYLGDGALYSGRHPHNLLMAALFLQREYSRVLAEDFPFDRGVRIALNYSRYRLLPIEDGGYGNEHRYEFFGQGIVELSRLATGKSMRDVDEIKMLLTARGYNLDEVNRFFAPMMEQNVDLLDHREEERGFYAYINETGTLVNQGIVATEPFVEQFARSGRYQTLSRYHEGNRRYTGFELEAGGDTTLVGIRKLGLASFKGLGQLAIYEILDGSTWTATAQPIQGHDLMQALNEEYSSTRQQFGNRNLGDKPPIPTF